jgi:hypothetical protein
MAGWKIETCLDFYLLNARRWPALLPSHAHYQVRHREAEEDEAEESGYRGAGGDDAEGR